MKKITTFIGLFLMITLGMSAQNVVLGFKNRNQEATSADKLVTGYYLLQSKQSDANKAGWMCTDGNYAKFKSEPKAGDSNMGAYVWRVEVGDDKSFTLVNALDNTKAIPASQRGNLTLSSTAGRIVAENCPKNTGTYHLKTQNTNFYYHVNGGPTLGGWDDQNEASLFESEFFQIPDDELIIAASVDVDYDYYIGDKLYKTVKVKQHEGMDYAAPHVDFVTILNYENSDKISTSNCKIRVNCKEALPFVPTTDISSPKWYAIDIHSNEAVYMWNYDETVTDKISTKTPQKGYLDCLELTDDSYYWCFVGDIVDGFKIYNKKKGFNEVLAKVNDYVYFVSKDNATSWKLQVGSGIANGVCFTADNGASYINHQEQSVDKTGGYLKFWQGNDQGSCCRFYSPLDVVNKVNVECVAPSFAVGSYSYFNDKNNRSNYDRLYSELQKESFDVQKANEIAKLVEAARATALNEYDSNSSYRITNVKRAGYLMVENSSALIQKANDGTNVNMIWNLNKSENNVTILHMNSQKSISDFDKVSEQAATFELEDRGNGMYSFKKGGNYLVQYSNGGIGSWYEAEKGGDGCWYIIPASELEVNMTAVEGNTYSSLYLPLAVTLPTGVKAYTGTLDEAKKVLTMHEMQGTELPKNTGVVLKADQNVNKITLKFLNKEVKAVEVNNGLVGSNIPVQLNEQNVAQYWVLGNGTLGLGFYHLNMGENGTATIPANKAFVNIPAGGAVNGYRLDFGDITGVEGVVEEVPAAEKVIYDLSGRRVAKMTKGLYIVNGKKVLVK